MTLKKEGRDLVSEAVSDAKALREAAVQAAKNQLLESMAPALKDLLEKSIKGVLSQNEDTDRIRRGIDDNWPGESHTGFEEAKEKGEPKMDDMKPDKKDGQELDLESLASFFPNVSEMPEEEGAPKMAEDPSSLAMGIPQLGEAEACDDDDVKAEGKKDKEDDKMDEEIELSESELRKVYEAALKVEAQVKKGFSEMTPNGELEDVVKDADKGVADMKKGEHVWEKETPPAKQDWMVKEMKEVIAKGLAENKQLRENLKKAVGMVQALGTKLHEVNLFNAKVLHVNKILSKNGSLTSEQKKVVLESIDKAKSIEEVRSMYDVLNSSFAVSSQLSESTTRKPVANAQRARTSGAPNQEVLRESVDRKNETFNRLQALAGLVK